MDALDVDSDEDGDEPEHPDLPNPTSELSHPDDITTPQYRGQQQRRTARISGALGDLPAVRHTQKLGAVLNTLRQQNLSLADFVQGIFASGDDDIRRYTTRFFDHSHGRSAFDAMIQSGQSMIQPWLIHATGNMLYKQIQSLRKEMRRPLSTYTRPIILGWTMAGAEGLMKTAAPGLFELLGLILSTRRQIRKAAKQSELDANHSLADPVLANNDPQASSSLPPSSPLPSSSPLSPLPHSLGILPTPFDPEIIYPLMPGDFDDDELLSDLDDTFTFGSNLQAQALLSEGPGYGEHFRMGNYMTSSDAGDANESERPVEDNSSEFGDDGDRLTPHSPPQDQTPPRPLTIELNESHDPFLVDEYERLDDDPASDGVGEDEDEGTGVNGDNRIQKARTVSLPCPTLCSLEL